MEIPIGGSMCPDWLVNKNIRVGSTVNYVVLHTYYYTRSASMGNFIGIDFYATH